MSDFKKTLSMPQTDFEMKANLVSKEPKIQEMWILEKIEKKILSKNKDNTPFILADGPPYANGNIHVGHALNKILKDIILRYKSLSGFYTKYIPGWDTHGLPIEQELLKKGINNDKELSIIEKRRNCQKFATENVYKQMDQFRRLGIMSEMDETYLTYELDYVIRQLKIFNKMLQKGLIFQDLKPVYWSWSSQTALADAEIIYKDSESDSIYVSFEILDTNDFVSKGDKIIIWTTTPYTLPSNLAVAANPKIEYAKIRVKNDFYIVSNNLVEKLSKTLEWDDYEILSIFPGTKLELVTYKHPLYEKKCKIIVDEYVSNENGTGLVHNAPGFGHEDYLACKKYNIKPFCPINEYGKFTSDVNDNQLFGMFYLDTNKIIIDRLSSKKTLLKYEKITHSTAHDWRTKKPVMYRATKQWFVNIKKIEKDIISELNKVKSIDPTIIKKMKEMISNRQEWCISRQRIWGVPICIIYDKDYNPIVDAKLMNNIIKILNQEGINSWYREDVKHFLTDDYNMSKKYIKETDIMDVWFDSGTSYSILQELKSCFPADLYFEGKDQFRGWFNSSLITSVAAFKKSPYKTLLTHGFVLDDKGNKMSKSLGNVIDPLQICKEYGADVLRIWVASVDYLDDVRISKEIINQNAELYRRIRNTMFRFILGNLKDFDYKKIKTSEYSQADLYILFNLSNEIKTIKNSYEKYDFKQIIKVVSKSISDLSSWYFDYIKDSLYCDEKDSPKRIAIQSTLYNILNSYIIMLAPIIPHTCEEAYGHFYKKNKLKSVHLEDFPTFKLDSKNKVDLEKWSKFFSLKDEIYSKIEQVRNEKIINSKGEAFVIISSKEEIPFDEKTICEYLGIAKIEFNKKDKGDLTIKVKNSKFSRCERCWNFHESENIKDSICPRCSLVIKNVKYKKC